MGLGLTKAEVEERFAASLRKDQARAKPGGLVTMSNQSVGLAMALAEKQGCTYDAVIEWANEHVPLDVRRGWGGAGPPQRRAAEPEQKWVAADEDEGIEVLVRLRADGTVTVATRRESWHSWGRPFKAEQR